MEETASTEIRSADVRPSGAETPAVRGAPLAAGSRVGNFTLERVIGIGGFGIVYLAVQDVTRRQVAIKEFFPSTMLDRVDSRAVRLRSTDDEALFSLGKRSFFREATILSELSHPGLVQVLHFWEENGTAYMAMPYYEGRPLSRMLKDGLTVTGDFILGLLDGLLPTLTYLHERRIFHRDISPDNIFMLHNGKPVLLDFGAARQILDKPEHVTVILKSGYAPVEQYDEGGAQGAWTDIYGLSALLFRLVTGHAPQISVGRICNDTVEPVARTHAGQFSSGLLHAIDAGLIVRPERRPQSVAAWKAILDAPDGEGPAFHPEQEVILFRQAKRKSAWPWLLMFLAVVATGAGAWWYIQGMEDSPRMIAIRAEALKAQLLTELPKIQQAASESDATVEALKRQTQETVADRAERQRVLLQALEKRQDAVGLYMDVQAKIAPELDSVIRRLERADAAAGAGNAEDARLLDISALQQLQSLKSGLAELRADRKAHRDDLVRQLEGQWGEKNCDHAAGWIVSGDIVRISRERQPPLSEHVLAVVDARIYTTPGADGTGSAMPTEYRLLKGKLMVKKDGPPRVLTACKS